jgi:hypothetical protein
VLSRFKGTDRVGSEPDRGQTDALDKTPSEASDNASDGSTQMSSVFTSGGGCFGGGVGSTATRSLMTLTRVSSGTVPRGPNIRWFANAGARETWVSPMRVVSHADGLILS